MVVVGQRLGPWNWSTTGTGCRNSSPGNHMSRLVAHQVPQKPHHSENRERTKCHTLFVLRQTEKQYDNDGSLNPLCDDTHQTCLPKQLVDTSSPTVGRHPDSQHQKQTNDTSLRKKMQIGIKSVVVQVHYLTASRHIDEMGNSRKRPPIIVVAAEANPNQRAIQEVVDSSLALLSS